MPGPDTESRAPDRDGGHSWLSNPLDWPHIDRMILLAGLVLLSPLAFGTGLFVTLRLWPAWFDHEVASGLLLLYAGSAMLLAAFIAAAFRLRRQRSAWPLMEGVVIASYLGVTYAESWLSGTHFTAGLLLVFLGMNITASLASIRQLHLAYRATVVAIVAAALAQQSGLFRYAPLFVRPPFHADGSPVAMWFLAQVVLALILLAILQIGLVATERWRNRENLFREMSTIDGLTRLTNRRCFIERSESEFVRAQRTAASRIACIMLDIDHFKSINDGHGHPAGDAVLVRVSAILMENARQYDEVGRYGGEEFAILLPGTTLQAAMQVAERLREKIAAERIDVGGERIAVTASFGVAGYPDSVIQSFGDLLKMADEALYRSKEGGRNRVTAAA